MKTCSSAHEGLTTEQSFELNVRLLMLLANQVGKREVLSGCIRLARGARRRRGKSPSRSGSVARSPAPSVQSAP